MNFGYFKFVLLQIHYSGEQFYNIQIYIDTYKRISRYASCFMKTLCTSINTIY